jgi:hypothetical protein
MTKITQVHLSNPVKGLDPSRGKLPAATALHPPSVDPERGKADKPADEHGRELSVPDDTLTVKLPDKWQRIFAEYLKQDEERLAASRAASPKPMFNHAAWRHRPLGEPKDRTNNSRKKAAHE